MPKLQTLFEGWTLEADARKLPSTTFSTDVHLLVRHLLGMKFCLATKEGATLAAGLFCPCRRYLVSCLTPHYLLFLSLLMFHLPVPPGLEPPMAVISMHNWTYCRSCLPRCNSGSKALLIFRDNSRRHGIHPVSSSRLAVCTPNCVISLGEHASFHKQNWNHFYLDYLNVNS